MYCKPLWYSSEPEAFRLAVTDRILVYDHGDVGRVSHASPFPDALKILRLTTINNLNFGLQYGVPAGLAYGIPFVGRATLQSLHVSLSSCRRLRLLAGSIVGLSSWHHLDTANFVSYITGP